MSADAPSHRRFPVSSPFPVTLRPGGRETGFACLGGVHNAARYECFPLALPFARPLPFTGRRTQGNGGEIREPATRPRNHQSMGSESKDPVSIFWRVNMQLASRFGRQSPVLRSREPLSDDQIRNVAPSIFAEAAHDSRSERYTYIPTSTVLAGLRKEGFQPFMVAQTRVRDEGKRDFTKHMLRLRHASQINDAEANEIILLNSHDGTSSYQMMAGMFRFVCTNGLVCGETVGDVRVRHHGEIIHNVIEGAFEVLDGFELVREQRDTMRGVTLEPAEAESSHVLRSL